MPSNKDMLLQLLSGGVEKGLSVGAAGAQQALKARAEAQAAQHKRQEDQTLFDRLRAENPKAAVKVGDFSVNPESDDLMSMLRYQLAVSEEDRRKENAKEQRIQKYTTTAAPISKAANALSELEASTNKDGKGGVLTNDGAQLQSRKGLSRLATYIPLVGDKINQMVHPDEASKIQGVLNTGIAEEAGLSQTLSEAERQAIAKAQIPGADSATVAEGIRTYNRAVQRRAEQANAILRPEDREEAYARGAFNPATVPGKRKKVKMSFEEWKKAKSEGKL